MFMLFAVSLGTFALVRALRSALNKDTIAMRQMNRSRPKREVYDIVGNQDDAIEDAFEGRQTEQRNEAREMASRKVAWKKIHAHVFRPPEKSILLALMLGAGTHALCMACLTVLLEFFYGQQNLAGLFIVTFPYFGVFNGYVSAKFYAYFNGSSWIALTLMSSILYPFVLFGCYFYIDWVDPAYAAKLYG